MRLGYGQGFSGRAVLIGLGLMLLFGCQAPAESVSSPVSNTPAPMEQANDAEPQPLEDRPPEPAEGWGALYEAIEYPAAARSKQQQGVVMIQGVVNKAGGLERPRVVMSVSPELDAEALRVVKSLTFKPAIKDGHPIRSRIRLPIQFHLNPPSPSN